MPPRCPSTPPAVVPSGRVNDLDAFVPGTLNMICRCLGSTSGICNKFRVVNGLGDPQ